MKACLLFTAGILISKYTNPSPYYTICLLGAGIIALILLLRNDVLSSIFALTVMILSGMCVQSIETELTKPPDILHELIDRDIIIRGKITGSPRHNYGNTYFIIDCSEISGNGAISKVTGEIPCVIYDKTPPLFEGSQLKVTGRIRRIRQILTKRNIASAHVPGRHNYRLIVSSLRVERNASGLTVFFTAVRNHVSLLIDRRSYMGHGDILRAMTIGDREGIPPETNKQFAQTGIAHILAVSGLHVGILLIVLSFILDRFALKKKIRYSMLIISLVFYAGICGFRPPVTRAVIMLSLIMGANLFERQKNYENSLFASMIIILALDPFALFGPSLQLTFAAVWTITTFHKPLMDILGERFGDKLFIKKTVSLIIVSFLASAGTAPFVAAHFKSFPLYGIPSNLIAVPLAFIIVPLGMTGITVTALGAAAAPFAAVLSFFTGFFITLLTLLTEFVSKLPYSSIDTGGMSLSAGLCFAVWLYFLSRSSGRQSFQKGLLYIPLVYVFITAWAPVVDAYRTENPEGTVIFFDVGQGDAALVEHSGERYFLVDTGPAYKKTSLAESLILPSLKNAGITRLDGIFISHAHSDHIGGLDSIVRSIQVDHIFCSTMLADSLVSFYGDRVVGLSAGDSIAVDEYGMLVLSPGVLHDTAADNIYADYNNRSLVIRCDLSGVRILFTGDIDSNIQLHAVSWGQALKADILKTPHHGGGGLNRDFVETVNPAVAVISCGVGNRYGHPAQSTLETLGKARSQIIRTDSKGTVIIKLPEIAISTL